MAKEDTLQCDMLTQAPFSTKLSLDKAFLLSSLKLPPLWLLLPTLISVPTYRYPYPHQGPRTRSCPASKSLCSQLSLHLQSPTQPRLGLGWLSECSFPRFHLLTYSDLACLLRLFCLFFYFYLFFIVLRNTFPSDNCSL